MEEIEEERERYLTAVKNPKLYYCKMKPLGTFFFFFRLIKCFQNQWKKISKDLSIHGIWKVLTLY